MQEVRESAQWVAEQSTLVRVNREAAADFAERLRSGETHFSPWDAFHHFRGSDEETVAYLLVMDALNFCFWPPRGEQRWEIEYGGKTFSGYYALALSLKRALEEGIRLTDAGYLADMPVPDLHRILAGRGELQLIDRRLENIRELGKVLLEAFHGKAHELVAAAQKSAVALVRILSDRLSSFRDIAAYEAREVFFLKRAQLLAADLHGAFDGRSLGEFHDMEELTAFADYKLPQVLRHTGILEYAEPLAEKVDQMSLLEPGSGEEVEIRANTIWAVELIRKGLEERGRKLKAFEIDWLLWKMGQEDRFRERPYHRTASIFY